MEQEKRPVPHCSVMRFVSQCTPNGKNSYGYHHQQCESQSHCEMHSTVKMTVEDAARRIRHLNGAKAIKEGFTHFFTHTQSYGGMTATGQPYLGSSPKVEVAI